MFLYTVEPGQGHQQAVSHGMKYAVLSRMSPIRLVEFAAALARSLPRRANPVIAIANSAGPDSTCLLFLLRQLFPPHALLSLHVVHNLQSASHEMALTAADNARTLGIPHHVAHIPWGVPPFPPLPTTGPVERAARDARYHLLFHAITRARASFLALGHHADDQVETAILRLARGSSLLGAAGMRPSRRWGMGSDSPLASFGHHGLNTFILRPLLPFSKVSALSPPRLHHSHAHFMLEQDSGHVPYASFALHQRSNKC